MKFINCNEFKLVGGGFSGVSGGSQDFKLINIITIDVGLK